MPEPLPRDHVRRPDLPWRVSTMVECGRPIADVATHIGRAEYVARVKELGVQRAGLITCMTCAQTAGRWAEWETDPVQALAREFYGRADPRLGDELRALAALVAAHRDEFDGYMDGIRETVDLAAARRARTRRTVRG